ncbi:MAG: YidB family protein [Betaproteobacteria bacterium]|jgi:uncharacterized protein YidB (DUF937 family)|nr:DUF937 domain-containing protein [Rhodocyclaceae bacterium]MCA3134153.1 DUF937 domain-containing protein [Rhodocyclaceae bacterium]MCA3142555.1 DUF937 domain-containing protein [Rhodocyclaceae bacterium]MCA3144304.1 DUF937 domain-containing protein [Rhodocyclaceae bacterium]MCE2897368.1 YidB family protein [Betaproteobacteria bacterium]
MSDVLTGLAERLNLDAVGHPNNLFNSVVFTLIEDYPGGLQGLLDRFASQGYANHVASWLSDGRNEPLAPEDVLKVCGREGVAALAAKLNLTPERVVTGLAEKLPDLINRLTPSNRVDEAFIRDSLPLLTGRVFG